MFGFVIAPKASDLWAAIGPAVSRLKTIAFEERIEIGGLTAWIYRTGQLHNCYRLNSDSGLTLVASGTLMLGTARGNHALQEIAHRLGRGLGLQEIYGELRGPFNLLIMDRSSQVMHVLTDREGLMCCYQSNDAAKPAVSSSLLLLASALDTSVDVVGVQEFVHGGAAINGRTLFAGVKRIPAATVRTWASGASTDRRMWQATVSVGYLPDSDDRIVDRMHSLFSNALDTEIVDGTKVLGTDLTAGTDSRTVLSFLLQSGKPVVASTAGAPDNVDVQRAKVLARKAGIEHWYYGVADTVDFDEQTLDECVELSDGAMNPFGLLKQVPYFIEKAARFDILFGGNGGPMFKDHYWLFEFNRINRSGEPNWDRIARYTLTEGKVLHGLFVNGFDYFQHMTHALEQNSRKIVGSNNQKLDFVYFDLKCQAFAAPQFTFSNRFMDVYHPMCDGRLVEYSISMRPWIRLRARLQSELIHRNHPGIAWVLTDNYVPCVPDTGFRYALRATRAIRYIRAARRKFRDFVFNRRKLSKDNRSLTFVACLKQSSFAAAYQDPAKLRLAPLLNLNEVSRLGALAAGGGHSGYLQRIFAVEAIVRKVESVGQRCVGIGPI
jgi:hypothetical protein